MKTLPGGYMGKLLRVDLTRRTIAEENLDESTLREYVGGTGFGARILYNEVPPGVQWSDPENRLIMASGPTGGTIGGTGTFSVVTKGPMTNGAVSSQASGFMGAYMKFSGFDGIIVQGAAKEPVYLHLHDGVAEIKDARGLTGKDTWETQDLIMQELQKTEDQLSVFSIGPAGEHLVRFAAIAGDRGHVAGHNGPGAVMASKKLKAVVAERGKLRPDVRNKAALSEAAKLIWEEAQRAPAQMHLWGTTNNLLSLEKRGALPVKNYTLQTYSESYKHTSKYFRPIFDVKRHPCWGCRFDHCSILTIKEGPYAGFTGEEPEYEGFMAYGPNTLQPDPAGAVVLGNEVDRYGLEINESGWIIAWLMECREKGLLTAKDMDGVDMVWGDVEAMRKMIRKIAYRDGFGDILAEGAMRAATRIGGEAANLAVFTKKGSTPRGHDHRVMWHMLLDVCTGSTGSDDASLGGATPASVGLPPSTDPYTPEGAAAILTAGGGLLPLEDSLPVCKLTFIGVAEKRRTELLNAVTGWDFTQEEGRQVGRRIINLLRAFNVRHGLTPDMEAPSVRYASAPAGGPAQGKTFAPVFDRARAMYYEAMGWDRKTGKPLPETLRKFGLDHVVNDLWK